MTEHQRWQQASITDDKQCPTCGKKMACKEHGWAYRKWVMGLMPFLGGMTGTTTAVNVAAEPSRLPQLLHHTSDDLDRYFYQSFNENFLYNRAAALLFGVLAGDTFKTRANEQLGLPTQLDDEFAPSLRADLYFSSLQQIELLLALLLAPYQPLSHWAFLSAYTTKKITRKAQNLIQGRFDELVTCKITSEREFVEQALYGGSKPPEELASRWNENLDNIWWLIDQMATKYIFATDHATYRRALHVKTALDFLENPENDDDDENIGVNLSGPKNFASDAFSFLEAVDKGEKEMSAVLTSKQFSIEESFFYIGAAQQMLKTIKSTRLAALRGEPLPPAALLFPDFNKDDVLRFAYRSSFSSSHII